MQKHVDAINYTTQPYKLAFGTKRSTIHKVFIVLDKRFSSLEVFELFKAHSVFGTVYNQMLHIYVFIQTTVYHTDVCKAHDLFEWQRYKLGYLNKQ